MSSRGQIVIPKQFRSGLAEGTLLAVSRKGDVIVLKKVESPEWGEFEKLLEGFEKIAKERGLKEKDVVKIVHKHRGVKY